MYTTHASAAETELDLSNLWSSPSRLSRPAQREIVPTASATDFLQRLQATLNVEHIIQLLAEEAGRQLVFEGLVYRCQAPATHCRLGRQMPHSAAYQLRIDQHQLGELQLFRERPFSETELAVFEALVSLIIYPLRNALLYLQALEQAIRDPLTGLLNRSSLDHHLNHEAAMARRHQHPLALLVADIDHFKAINDHYGHLIGDNVLTAVAHALRDNTRQADLAFRYGGEEFLILLPDTDQNGAMQLAEKLRQAVAALRPEQLDPAGRGLSVSIGVAELGRDEAVERFFHHADTALLHAKSQGRNRVCAF